MRELIFTDKNFEAWRSTMIYPSIQENRSSPIQLLLCGETSIRVLLLVSLTALHIPLHNKKGFCLIGESRRRNGACSDPPNSSSLQSACLLKSNIPLLFYYINLKRGRHGKNLLSSQPMTGLLKQGGIKGGI